MVMHDIFFEDDVIFHKPPTEMIQSFHRGSYVM